MKSSFPPVINPSARVLVLGSLPGDASLAVQQYYAFKQNAFWRIMAELFGIDSQQPYPHRLAALQKKRLALWDVVARGEREGSLDIAIQHQSLVANDFTELLANYANINAICLNGKSVEALFKRHVLKKQKLPFNVDIHVLPSTSPANARMSFDEKLERWSLLKKLVQ
ncbi:hypothetical protein TDB9533_03651 [Thalassocella blandensis]|nr:hypothetical protein TDB9533_03651 [Thalassocella blandensis]